MADEKIKPKRQTKIILTENRQAKLAQYVEPWLNVLRQPLEPTNEADATAILLMLKQYVNTGLDGKEVITNISNNDPKIWFCDDPAEAIALATCAYFLGVDDMSSTLEPKFVAQRMLYSESVSYGGMSMPAAGALETHIARRIEPFAARMTQATAPSVFVAAHHMSYTFANSIDISPFAGLMELGASKLCELPEMIARVAGSHVASEATKAFSIGPRELNKLTPLLLAALEPAIRMARERYNASLDLVADVAMTDAVFQAMGAKPEKGWVERFDLMTQLVRSLYGWIWTGKNIFAVRRPQVIALDNASRFHSAEGPAIKFADYEAFYWHGVAIDRNIIEHPQTITVEQIREQDNTEVRRIMLERFGIERFAKEAELILIDESSEGKLFVSRIGHNGMTFNDIAILEVVNSTPEGVWETLPQQRVGIEKLPSAEYKPELGDIVVGRDPETVTLWREGRRFIPQLDAQGNPIYKHYWLHVNNGHRTAKDAVAATFGMRGRDYTIESES